MTRLFKSTVTFLALILFFRPLFAQKMGHEKSSPISVVETVANKIIRESTFKFQLVIPPNADTFDFVQFVDFGRTFGLGKPGVAYAVSQLESKSDTSFVVQVSHNDALKIWLNGKTVYQKDGARKLNIQPRERDVALESEFIVNLKKGTNKILVKSETKGNEWIFYIQPKGALIEGRLPDNPKIGLSNVSGVTSEVAKLTNWLVMGPFDSTGSKSDAFGPEQELEIGKLYTDGSKKISWTIPKIEVFADVIDPKPYWGVYYNWNYHTGGVAWAMSNLSEATGVQKYDDYAKRWTDFILEKKPFIGYQVNTLNGFQSTHHQLFNTPLLDFTAAPTLPFIHRLVKQKNFDNRAAYVDFVKEIKNYVVKEQIRLPGGNFTRETPEKFTTWVDDMYMGIPFLIQAALETNDSKEKKALIDDAANQLIAFNKQLFNYGPDLYQHVQYSTRKAQFPYWSRANGWGIWATTEVLQHLDHKHPLRKKIMEVYIKHVNALVKLQNKESGAWHNLLNRPDSYEELSGTAIISMTIARGINEGWLKREKYLPAVKKGWNYIESCIEDDGTVHNICVGTMSSENINDYMERPKIDDDSHGIIGLIFAGIEIEKLFNHVD